MKLTSTITHKNGGIEQAILEAVKETQGLSVKGEARLSELKALPQNRTEMLRKDLEAQVSDTTDA